MCPINGCRTHVPAAWRQPHSAINRTGAKGLQTDSGIKSPVPQAGPHPLFQRVAGGGRRQLAAERGCGGGSRMAIYARAVAAALRARLA